MSTYSYLKPCLSLFCLLLYKSDISGKVYKNLIPFVFMEKKGRWERTQKQEENYFSFEIFTFYLIKKTTCIAYFFIVTIELKHVLSWWKNKISHTHTHTPVPRLLQFKVDLPGRIWILLNYSLKVWIFSELRDMKRDPHLSSVQIQLFWTDPLWGSKRRGSENLLIPLLCKFGNEVGVFW